MISFISGVLFMYVLAMPLMMYIMEPLDEEDPNAPTRFAVLWPVAAVETLYIMIRGDKNDDGTGST